MAKHQAKKKPASSKKPTAKKPLKAQKPAPKLVKKTPSAKKAPPKAAATKVTASTSLKKAIPVTTKTKSSATPSAAASKAKSSSPALRPEAKTPKPHREYKAPKLPAGYKPSLSEPYMNQNQLEYFRQKLLVWRKELMDESRETLDHLHEENWHQADIADRAALETEAGVELRTRNRYLKLVSKIDAAIRRIEEGEYGYCEETGEPIGLKRLEARPVATLSIEAQERHEKSEKQYIDED